MFQIDETGNHQSHGHDEDHNLETVGYSSLTPVHTVASFLRRGS